MSRTWFRQSRSPMLTKLNLTLHTTPLTSTQRMTLLTSTLCLELALVGSAMLHLPTSPISASYTSKERQRLARRTSLPNSNPLYAMVLATLHLLSRSRPFSFRTEVIIRPMFQSHTIRPHRPIPQATSLSSNPIRVPDPVTLAMWNRFNRARIAPLSTSLAIRHTDPFCSGQPFRKIGHSQYYTAEQDVGAAHSDGEMNNVFDHDVWARTLRDSANFGWSFI